MNDLQARAEKTARYAKAYGKPKDDDLDDVVRTIVTIDTGD